MEALRKLCKSYCAAHLLCRVLAPRSPIYLICLATRSAASRIWACSRHFCRASLSWTRTASDYGDTYHKWGSGGQESSRGTIRQDYCGLTYDPEVDVLRIVFRDVAIEESDEDKPGVILDYDKDGNIVGLEVLNAYQRVENPRGVDHAVTG